MLTKDQLEVIAKQASDELALALFLVKQHPQATIAVLRGYDNLRDEAYTQSAYFDEKKARKAMKAIRQNETGILSDTYHILTGTVKDLQIGKFIDKKTKQPLTKQDKHMVYASLQERLIG